MDRDFIFLELLRSALLIYPTWEPSICEIISVLFATSRIYHCQCQQLTTPLAGLVGWRWWPQPHPVFRLSKHHFNELKFIQKIRKWVKKPPKNLTIRTEHLILPGFSLCTHNVCKQVLRCGITLHCCVTPDFVLKSIFLVHSTETSLFSLSRALTFNH